MKHTPFIEALMRAYMLGWSDGQSRCRADANVQRVVAETLATQNPRENAAPKLLEACKLMVADFGQLEEGGWSELPSAKAGRAAIAKAETTT